MSSGWTDLDVSPVGREAGADTPATPNPHAPAHDPFGGRPSRLRRGWVRIVAGVVLVVAGVVATIVGIVDAVAQRGQIESEAVARGVVREGGPPEPVTFTSGGDGKRAYSVYLIFPGFISHEPEQELTVRDTACEITLPGGEITRFRGARQGTAVELEQAASVGHFTSAPGRVTATCAYTEGTRSSQRVRPERVAFVVTPGTPSAHSRSIVMIVVGGLAATGGGFLAGWGWRGRRVAV